MRHDFLVIVVPRTVIIIFTYEGRAASTAAIPIIPKYIRKSSAAYHLTVRTSFSTSLYLDLVPLTLELDEYTTLHCPDSEGSSNGLASAG